MDSKVSLETIEHISRKARPDMESLLNCNPINPTIRKELENNGLQVQQITGTFSTRRSHVGGESHMFLKVDSNCISNCSSPIIVDGAIDQFCIENYDAGRVFEQIGPKEEIPKVAVLTRHDELYDCFYEVDNI